MSASSDSGSSTPPSLEQFGGRNLTVEARRGELDPVLGREREIERVMEVLVQRANNIPVLVGEPGVGKTGVAEWLAQKIVKGEVPDMFKGKQLYMLDLRALVASSMPGGRANGDRLQEALEEITARGDIILFIDNLHTLVDANAAEGAMTDAAAILKPLLARGELQTIGATTPDEYRKYLEKDPALERRFRPIQVAEPTISHTIEILKGLRERYEAHHRVSITDGALVASAQLADRYISDRLLPGKAIDLIDEAGSRMRIRRITAPPDGREYDEMIAQVRREKESAIDSQDFEKAAALRHTEKQLLAKKASREKEWKAGDMDVVAEVNEELIAEIVAETISIPVAEVLESLVDVAAIRDAGDGDVVAGKQAYILLNDQPVGEKNNDLLGTSTIAAGIASMLAASREASPFVMAIDGRWGMGKSTLLRQIESQLPGGPEVVAVRFNAWTAEGKNALEGLIKSVLVKLDPVVVRRWAKLLARQRHVMLIARLASALIGRFFGVARLVDELWTQLGVDAKSRNELRDLIQGMLSDWSMRPGKHGQSRALVVFIDDLDRCSDEVVVQVCEAVKLYLDAPGLIFVIACDLSVLARGVSSSARGEVSEGRAYLEKIVQVAYRLPPPQEAQIKYLIRGYAQQSGTAALIDETVTTILADRAGRNPRSIKRIINSLVVEYRLNPAWRQPPLGSVQLVRAILLQHLYTAFYDLLISEELSEDPIGTFLEYAAVRAKAADPPAADHAWWSTASRLFQRYGMPAPERSRSTGKQLTLELERLERELPNDFPVLARNSAFVALLGGVGNTTARQALRAQLLSRPLGTETLITDRADTAPINLGVALVRMVGDQAARGLRVNQQFDALPADIPALVVEALSGAIREALTNAAQHANVEEVWLTAVGDERGGVTIAVIDRGRGFDMDVTRARLGLGLTRSIQERVLGIGGRVKINSTPGHGTIVEMSWTP